MLRTGGRESAPAPHQGQLRGDIEGLRAIAVCMVLLFHVRAPGWAGGFAGVDVFFVISGYLITRLLLVEAQSRGTVSLGRFYARRARRLLPAATLVLVLTALVGRWLLPRSRFVELGQDTVASASYVMNWLLAAREVDYLDEGSPPSLLMHYWSLSVEEQFYVVWPTLILLVLAACRRWRLKFVPILTLTLIAVGVISFIASVRLTATSSTAYFTTVTRVWELTVGALLVLLAPALRGLPRKAGVLLAHGGLVLLLITVGFVSEQTPWPGTAALAPTIGTALVIAGGIVAAENPVARALGTPPMRWIGGLSYGLYLWHWPLLALLAERVPEAGLGQRLLVATAAVLLAWGTKHLVEDPIRFSPALATSSRRPLMLAGATSAASAAVAVTVILSGPQLVPTTNLATPVDRVGPGALSFVDPASANTDDLRQHEELEPTLTLSGPVAPDPAVAKLDDSPAYHEGCLVGIDDDALVPDHACWFGDPDGDVVVAVIGDSKAEQWSSLLIPLADRQGWRLKFWTKAGCPPVTVGHSADCARYNERLSAHLSQPDEVPDLVIVSGGVQPVPGAVESLVSVLGPVRAAGAKVVTLADTPDPQVGRDGADRTALECAERHLLDLAACDYTRNDGAGTPVLRAGTEQLGGIVVDLNEWFCPAGHGERCPVAVGGVLTFRQGSHVTATYLRTLAPFLDHELMRLGLIHKDYASIRWRAAVDLRQG